jgi:hypothetical protein
MRARNGRDRRARRLHYFLRDLAGDADVKRLLSADIRRQPIADDDDDDAPNDEPCCSCG